MSINKEKTIICEFCLRIIDKSFTGKKPPEEIKVKARLRELNALIEKILRITKIIKVNSEYNNNILTACLNISELSK